VQAGGGGSQDEGGAQSPWSKRATQVQREEAHQRTEEDQRANRVMGKGDGSGVGGGGYAQQHASPRGGKAWKASKAKARAQS
jgi:hypothetical protein